MCVNVIIFCYLIFLYLWFIGISAGIGAAIKGMSPMFVRE